MPRYCLCFRIIIAIVLCTPLFFACGKAEKQVAKPMEKAPNLLFIFPDQFRNAAVGINDQDPVHTPHMDKIAREGLVVNNAISNYPLCSPYRAMLMTGKLPYNNTVLSNCNSNRYAFNNSWQKEDVSFSDVLVANGYNAGYVGKLHLTSPAPIPGLDSVIWDAYTPMEERHGFGFWYSYGTFDQHHKPHYWVNEAPEEQLHYVEEWSPIHEADVIIDYINNRGQGIRDPDKPFAMFWSVNPPHPPYPLVPEEYLSRYADQPIEELLLRGNIGSSSEKQQLDFHPGATGDGVEAAEKHVREYFAMVTGVDEQIGRVMEALEANGLADNTIVVITSDHGEMMGSHGLMSKNIWFDESINIPFIIRWPDKIKGNQRSDIFISATDVMPTMLHLLGAKTGLPDNLDGRDLSEYLLRNSEDGPDSAIYYYIEQGDAASGHRGIKTSQNTFVIAVGMDGQIREFMYDNINDPFQQTNLLEEDGPRREKLRERLLRQLEEKEDPWLQRYLALSKA